MSKLLIRLLTPCLFLLFVCLPAQGQSSTATLSGTVVDSNGAVVPGASVTLTDTGKGFERKVTTDNEGSFVLPLLQPSNYTLLVAREGFASAQVENVILNVADSRALRVELKISPVKGEVIVTPDASLVSNSPEVSSTVDRTFVGNLPLNGRSFQSLILLTPGIVFNSAGFNSPGEFSVNGQRANANYFTVDGVSANVGMTRVVSIVPVSSNSIAGMLPGLGASGSTSAMVSVDALEEFKIQTSTYSAQYGRQPGGQVQLVTRSGGNQYHGTLFEYIRNEAFDARNFFNRKPFPQPATRQNQFGGTFSGPVILPRFGEGGPSWYNGKDRTFFFFSYEGQRLLLPNSGEFAVPSLRLRQLVPAELRPILNAFPLPTGDEVLSDMDNDPTTPLTGSGGAPFVASFSNPKSQDATSIRIDHRINGKHTIFGRYNYAPSNSLTRSLAQLYGEVNEARTLTIGTTSSLTSRISNEFRFNHTRNRAEGSGRLDDFGGAVPIDVSLLLPGYIGDLNKIQGRFALFTAAGYGEIFIGDNTENVQRQFHLVDNILWEQGNHSFRFGLDFRRLVPVYGPVQYQRSANSSIFNNAQQAQFLNGQISRVSIQGLGSGVRPRFDNFSAYFQDTWKISPRLTLDLGVRWEFNPAPTEADGKKPVLVVGAENMQTARLALPNEPFFKTFYTAFAPRFGASYLLNQKAGRETVLRGGFGVYYDLNSGSAAAPYTGFPFILSKSLTNVQWSLTPEQATLPPQPSVTLPISDPLYGINQGLKLPYTLQWNLSVQQALGNKQTVTASYVASAGRQLTTTTLLNQPLGNSDGPRLNSDFGDVTYVSNGPASDYHSMQIQYNRRLSRGLQALVNYTWSHAIDEVSSEAEPGTLIRGNASFDIRHNFTAALTYDVPRWKRFPVIDAILRDWSIDTVLLAYSGRPLEIFIGLPLNTSDGSFQEVRPDRVLGVPLWIEDPNAPGGQKINVAAFSLPPLDLSTFRFLRAGTLGRNVVREPGIHQVNLGIRRQFNLGERMNLQLKAEAFNLFNTPVLSGYSNFFWPGSSFFGKASQTLNLRSNPVGSLNSLYALGGPRSMQFSVRFSF